MKSARRILAVLLWCGSADRCTVRVRKHRQHRRRYGYKYRKLHRAAALRCRRNRAGSHERSDDHALGNGRRDHHERRRVRAHRHAHGRRVLVNAPDADVTLVLQDADITCSDSSALYIYKAASVLLYLPDGTASTLTDGSSYNYSDSVSSAAAEEPNACLYAKSDLIIAGGGTLTVTAMPTTASAERTP